MPNWQHSETAPNELQSKCLRTLQIDQLNNDPTIHGIIVQMPLDSEKPIDADLITNSVLAEKDVDG